MSNSLDADQARHFVVPILGPNKLQWLSAGDTRRQSLSKSRCDFLKGEMFCSIICVITNAHFLLI